MLGRDLIKKCTVLIFLLVAGKITAQDFHLSQYEANPQYLNPALTGVFFDKDYSHRLNSNHRSQWGSISEVAYSTFSAGYDYAFEEKWGVGGYLINNHSGIERFNTLTSMLSAAYRIMEDPTRRNHLSVGLQMGMFIKSYNYSNLLFEQQYSVYGGLDDDLPSGEYFEMKMISRFDVNVGVFYKFIGDIWQPYAGLSLYHITMPNESFTNIKHRLPIRYSKVSGIDFVFDNGFTLSPSILYVTQARAYEAYYKILLAYKLEDSNIEVISGLGFRAWDAMVFYLGFNKTNYAFRFSYDFNTSYLNRFSGGNGAWEFSAVYYGGKLKNK